MYKKFQEIYIFITKDCNLRCGYCSQTHTKGFIITEKIIDDFFEKFLNDLFYNHDRINIYGGEPLLYFDKVIYILDKLSDLSIKLNKTITISIATNGILLNDRVINYFDSLKSNNLLKISLVLSLDGDFELTHLNRGLSKNQFELILTGIKKIKLLNNKNISLESSTVIPITSKKIDYLKSIKYLFKLELDKYIFILEQDINNNHKLEDEKEIYIQTLNRISILKKVLPIMAKYKHIDIATLGTEPVLSLKPNGDIYNIICPDFLNLSDYKDLFFIDNIFKIKGKSYLDDYILKNNIFQNWDEKYDKIIYDLLFKNKREILYKNFLLLQNDISEVRRKLNSF